MWLLCSYGRRERLKEALAACVAAGMTTPGLVLVNGDDKTKYKTLKLPAGWRIMTIPGNPRIAECYRTAFEQFPNEPWYGFMADDVHPQTPGWDVKLIETAGTCGIASANDLWQFPARMHGATVMSGNLVRAVGYIVPPGVRHCFIDDMWEMIGAKANCWTRLSDVITEHKHAWNGKAKMDATYERGGANLELLAEDKPAYDAWLQAEGDNAAVRVLQARGQRAQTVQLAGTHLIIATPAYGGQVTTNYLNSLCGTLPKLWELGINYDLITVPNESMVHRARNHLVQTFIDRGGSHLLFIDADMGWSPDAVIRLLAISQIADCDVVAAAGPRRQTPASFCVNFDGPNIEAHDATASVYVKEVGTGFMLISRRCIDKMVAAYPDRRYADAITGQKYAALFEPLIKDGFQWSEDYVFCQRWRAIGGKILVDPSIGLDHVGSNTWTDALQQQLAQNLVQVSPMPNEVPIPQDRPVMVFDGTKDVMTPDETLSDVLNKPKRSRRPAKRRRNGHDKHPPAQHAGADD